MAEIRPSRHQSKSGKTFFIRAAQGKDAKKVLACASQIIAEERYSVTSPIEFLIGLESQIEFLESFRKEPDRIFLVAETENREIIGTIDFTPSRLLRHRHWGEFGMGVIASHRGQGVGQALLESLLQWAERQGSIEKVCLSVHADNTRAIALYKKLGFEIEGIRKRETCFGPGEYVDAVLMAKFLNDAESTG
ncbi:MAG: GNAT family N-acetyltransferase [Bdellovibrionia bacterium]